VTVDGRVLPREQVIVMLHIGHSNMAGRARNPASERPYFYDPHPQLWVYARGGAFRAAREPTSPDNMSQGRAGPGMALLRNALARAPSALVVSIGHGHTGPAGGVCRSYRKGGLLYDIVMGPAVELRGKVTFGAIFGMFGISEVNDMANAARVGECLEGVAREMRADLGDPEVPFVVGGWEQAMTDLGPDSEVAQIIMPQLALVPMRIPRAVLIPTDGLPIEEDDHHYTMTGHRLWAERGFDLLAKANLIPWAAAR
jgi:hypothetical protein